MEAGGSGPNFAELEKLLDVYGVDAGDYRDALLDLQKQGQQRGWWSKFGRLPEPSTKFLGFEAAAVRIRVFEPVLIPGLLQTEEYARAVMAATPRTNADDIERWVRLRLERQRTLLRSTKPPELWFVVDEAAIRRRIGGPETQRVQLESLLDGPYADRTQIVPLSAGAHPGVSGGFTIFDFDPDVRPAVVHVETQAGDLCLDDWSDVDRCTVSYDLLRSVALGPPESRTLVAAVIKELQE